MLKIYNNPPRREWPALTARCTRQEGEITERGRRHPLTGAHGGDKALRDLVARIEGYVPERFEVSRRQRTEAAKAVPQRLKTRLRSPSPISKPSTGPSSRRRSTSK